MGDCTESKPTLALKNIFWVLQLVQHQGESTHPHTGNCSPIRGIANTVFTSKRRGAAGEVYRVYFDVTGLVTVVPFLN